MYFGGKNGRYFTNKNEYIEIMNYLNDNLDIVETMGEQAKITSEMHSIEFFAKSILKVDSGLIEPYKKTIIDKLKEKLRNNRHE